MNALGLEDPRDKRSRSAYFLDYVFQYSGSFGNFHEVEGAPEVQHANQDKE